MTYPGAIALTSVCKRRAGVLTLDAHLGVRDLDRGLNNGNPIRALIEAGIPGDSVVQVGLQPFSNAKPYQEFARNSGVKQFSVTEVMSLGIEAVISESLSYLGHRCDAVYVNCDVDVLDLSYAPSAAGSRVGGLPPSVLFRGLQLLGQSELVRALDIVEHDPGRDRAGITSEASAKIPLTFAASICLRSHA